ncbi:chymotrypsin-like protease CTRL-1 [Schistocerca gregaria]|uniref:chymotrypsin-like protease CTRL-1 n=1 Tax=Schistocerca gregaria TaxID=7010 RepID=UPI00211E8CFA|nr:chymotrypsin-like protease CTRL-1 [Schistocerca gregaria]
MISCGVVVLLANVAVGLVIVEEEDPRRWVSAAYYTPSHSANSGSCPMDLGSGKSHPKCVPLSSCQLISDLMDRSCLAPGKLSELVCGYRGMEPLVCCPAAGLDTGLPPSPTRPPQDSPVVTKPTGFSGKCGQPIVRSSPGGLGSQPWVARVGFVNVQTGGQIYPCSGSIISPNTILTAAHCALAQREGFKLATVRVGEYDSRGDPDCTPQMCAFPVQDIPINHVVVHPGFQRINYKHDIALLVLKSSMNYSLAAQPICILQNGDVPLQGRRGRLIGWGKLPGQTGTPARQQQLELPIVALDQCRQIYSSKLPVTNDQLCVGGEQGRDACSGFGGAPLVLLDGATRTRYYQVGMASFGSNKCGAANIPSVYTNIQKYADWIKNNM